MLVCQPWNNPICLAIAAYEEQKIQNHSFKLVPCTQLAYARLNHIWSDSGFKSLLAMVIWPTWPMNFFWGQLLVFPHLTTSATKFHLPFKPVDNRFVFWRTYSKLLHWLWIVASVATLLQYVHFICFSRLIKMQTALCKACAIIPQCPQQVDRVQLYTHKL
jgi:hypothetical protein